MVVLVEMAAVAELAEQQAAKAAKAEAQAQEAALWKTTADVDALSWATDEAPDPRSG